MTLHRFNIRVYGIWITDNREVLVADEIVWGRQITKFPGGGLEFGEGPADAIHREWQEELGVSLATIQQFYFTDFCVPSFMNDGSQVVSLYFTVTPSIMPTVRFTTQPFDFDEPVERAEAFRFIPLNQLSPNDFTFPIDQHVARLIIDKC